MKALIRFLIGLTAVISMATILAVPAQAQQGMQDAQGRDPQTPTNRPKRVVAVTVRNFEVKPVVIHMTVNERVELDLTAAGQQIGIRVNPFPDGAKANTPPGLAFLFGEDCYKIKKDQMTPILVEATEPGSYTIGCCKDCGSNHKKMQAQIIVDPPK